MQIHNTVSRIRICIRIRSKVMRIHNTVVCYQIFFPLIRNFSCLPFTFVRLTEMLPYVVQYSTVPGMISNKVLFFHKGIRQLQPELKKFYQCDKNFGAETSEEPCIQVRQFMFLSYFRILTLILSYFNVSWLQISFGVIDINSRTQKCFFSFRSGIICGFSQNPLLFYKIKLIPWANLLTTLAYA